MNPLQGIRVLDLTRLLPGSVCTMMLADLGAEVIKIEDPNGGDYARWMPPLLDGLSVYFRMNNRSKRSVILNLKEKEGQAVLKKLVESADVLIEGFRPGVMERLNCDYERLKKINPRLVYCALSGWGMDGPYKTESGHDLNYTSLSGLNGSMADPQVIGGQVGDIGGAYVAVAGILAALFRRERGGGGGFVDASLAESVLPFMLYTWTESLFRNTSGGEGGLSGGAACYRVYTARDLAPVSLAAIEPKFWTNFCNAVERSDLIENYTDPTRQDYLIRELSEIFASKTSREWQDLLGAADCCFTLVVDPCDIGKDPHFKARRMLGQFEDGSTWMRSPIRVSDSQPKIENEIPVYGQHTREILASAGYSDDEIKSLAESGVIKLNQ